MEEEENAYKDAIKQEIQVLLSGLSEDESSDGNLSSEEESIYRNSSKKKRHIPHIVGNYASLVYIEVSFGDLLVALQAKVSRILLTLIQLSDERLGTRFNECFANEEFADFFSDDQLHVSLSKTLMLRQHFIGPFKSILESKISSRIASFQLRFNDSIDVYWNETRDRLFFAVGIDSESCVKWVNPLIDIVDDALSSMGLPVYYAQRMPHASIASTTLDLGPILNTLSDKIPSLGGKNGIWRDVHSHLESQRRCENPHYLPRKSLTSTLASSLQWNQEKAGNDKIDSFVAFKAEGMKDNEAFPLSSAKKDSYQHKAESCSDEKFLLMKLQRILDTDNCTQIESATFLRVQSIKVKIGNEVTAIALKKNLL